MCDLRDSLADRMVVMVTHNAADVAIGDIRIDLGASVPEIARV